MWAYFIVGVQCYSNRKLRSGKWRFEVPLPSPMFPDRISVMLASYLWLHLQQIHYGEVMPVDRTELFLFGGQDVDRYNLRSFIADLIWVQCHNINGPLILHSVLAVGNLLPPRHPTTIFFRKLHVTSADLGQCFAFSNFS